MKSPKEIETFFFKKKRFLRLNINLHAIERRLQGN